MHLVVRDAGQRLHGAKAARAALAALKHTSAQQQQDYRDLVSQHEQLQEAAAVCMAKLASAEAVKAADALLLKRLIPSLVLECAAELSIQWTTVQTCTSAATSPACAEARYVCWNVSYTSLPSSHSHSTKADFQPSNAPGCICSY
jgi:hypothetical protein